MQFNSVKDKIFDFFVYLILITTVLICIIPFIHVLALSLSSTESVLSRKVSIIPIGFNLEAYYRVLCDSTMIKSFLLTVGVTLVFTILGLLVTIALAYPLSRENLKGKRVFTILVIFTLYFSGGLIPTYLNINDLHLMNNLWSLILPLILSPFNMIIMKTFFVSSIPASLEESARLDGCSHMGILIKIILPLSKPVLATLALFFAVGRWNAFQDALFYISDRELYPLQLKLYYLVSSMGSQEALSFENGGGAEQLAPEVVKSATIMFATIPIMLIYPKLQKYFVSGVMVGAVKG